MELRMSQITTHILDTSKGTPAENICVRLEKKEKDGVWDKISSGTTDSDGRIMNLLYDGDSLDIGLYKMIFITGPYFERQGIPFFYPEIEICFLINNPKQHYHIPLLLSPFGYSTYRGS